MSQTEHQNTDNLITQHLGTWTSAIQTKSASGRGSSKKRDLYGIKKLRELILELAVRGKLVPQDPNDEPASVLLERIAAEKAELVKQKKIKKPKKLPEIGEDEKPFELPVGWEWCRLNEICLLENGDRSKNYPNKSLLVESGVPFVNAGHLQAGKINRSEMTFMTPERFDLLRAGKFLKGDILYCLRGSLGKSAIVDSGIEGAIASSLVIVRAFEGIVQRYLQTYFDSPMAAVLIKKYDNGTAQPNLSATDLAKFLVPVPNVEVQSRIVAKVDELMALCDQLEQQTETCLDAHATLVDTLLGSLLLPSETAEETFLQPSVADGSPTDSRDDVQDAQVLREAGMPGATADTFERNWARLSDHFDTLFTTEQSIDALKQTILQLAVMGKLVPQDPNDEPASQLLERIATEKAELVKQKKIKKQKPLPTISEEEKPFSLPQGWEWSRVGICTHVFAGNAFKSGDFNEVSGTRVVKITNAGVGEFIETSDFLPTSFAKKFEQYQVVKGDLIIALTRPYISSGLKVSVCPEGYSGALLNQRVAAIRPMLHTEFAYLHLRSPSVLSHYQNRFSGSGLQPNLKMSDVTELFFALPPMAEQQRIVAKVDQLMALCDQLKSRLQHAQQTQLHLADAMVEKALAEKALA